MSTNAPKSTTLLTVPVIVSPTLTFSSNAALASSFSLETNCFLSPITLLFLGLYSVRTNSISCPSYLLRSLSKTSETKLAGINTLAPSTSTLKPPFKICTTGALRTSLFSNASSSLLFAFSAASLLYDKAT